MASSSTSDPPEPAPGAKSAPSTTQELRIISVSPALTRTLVDLGLRDRVVGRTPWCAAVDGSVPVVGTLTDLDFERLIRLKPTHLIIQPPAAGPDPQLLALAGESGWTVGSWQMSTLDDVRRTIAEMPDVLPSTAERSTTLLAELDAALAATTSRAPGRTLLIDGTDPVLVHGRGTYLGDLLERLGGVNAATQERWAEVPIEVLAALDFDTVIFVRVAGETVTPLEAAGPLAELDCMRNARLGVLQHPDTRLPSSGLIGVAAELRRVLDELAEGP